MYSTIWECSYKNYTLHKNCIFVTMEDVKAHTYIQVYTTYICTHSHRQLPYLLLPLNYVCDLK